MNIHPSCLIAATLFFLLPHAGMGQATDKNGVERSPEEIKRAIGVVEQRLERQESRVSDLHSEIIRLDGRIEKEVDRIVENLKNVGDSKDSRIRVAQTKGKVIEGLKRSIDIYQQKRSQIRAQLTKTRSDLEKAQLEKDRKVFDEKSEKRIDQIMELANSLTTHEDYKKYDTYVSSSSRRWGRDNVSQQKNEDYVQNKRVTTITDKERKEILDALRKSIEDLKTQNRSLIGRLDSPNFANQKGLIQEDIERNKQAIGRREARLEEMLAPTQPSTTPISQRAAHEMELMIRDIADDLKRDFNTLFRHYSEFVKERAQSDALKEQLDELKKMLL